MADLREQKAITKELERQRDLLIRHNEESKVYQQAQAKIRKLSADLVNLEEQLNKKRDRVSKEANTLNIQKQIERLQKTGLGSLNKKLSLESQIKILKEGQSKNDKETVRQTKAYSDLLQDVATGSKDLEAVLNTIATEDFGIMNEAAEQLAETLRNSPNLTDKLRIEAQAQQKIDDFRDKISEASAFLSSPKAMGVAAVGLLVQQMGDFVSKAFEARQALGTTAVESARVAGNLKVAGLAAKAVGGSSEQAEAAVMSLVDEFGSVSVISAGVSKQLGLITGQFGLSGDNAGKLLKQMQAINGASIETNLELIGAVGELARAEGVAPAKVLNDIAGDTETFAKFAKDGGKNIGAAAIQAAKLGLSMATVAGIAENLLDFETSIEKQMEASVLLGRQVNLDKARELSLMGDLEGLQKEVLKQVGSEAEFNAMNVVQRKSLADAIGVSVADLGKMVAGEKTSAQVAEDQVKAQKKQADLQMAMMGAMVGMQAVQASIVALEAVRGGLLGKNLAKTVASAGASLAKGVGSIFSGLGFLGPVGIGLALAATAGMFALSRKAASEVPKAETGGMVTKSGLAEIHKGEAISGTKNEMGFGADMTETNRLLKQSLSESKQLREQNLQLMNRLTNKVGDLALSS